MIKIEDIKVGCKIETPFNIRNRTLLNVGHKMPTAMELTDSLTWSKVIVPIIGINLKHLSAFVDITSTSSINKYSISYPDQTAGYLDKDGKDLWYSVNKKSYVWALQYEFITHIVNDITINKIYTPVYCKSCNDMNPYGEANQSDGSHLCWSCKQDPYRASVLSLYPDYDY